MAEEEIQSPPVNEANEPPETPPATSESDEDERRRAVAEILAELSDEIGGDQDEADDEEQPPEVQEPQEPQEPEPEPQPEPQAEAAQQPIEEPTPEPAQEPIEEPPHEEPEEEPPAPEPSPQPIAVAAPSAGISPKTLVLVHAGIIVVFFVGTWLTTRSIVGAVVKVAARPTVQAAVGEPAGELAAPPAPKPQAATEPVVQVDKGLRYVQLVEKADVLFEKGEYGAAAKTYEEALAAMPKGWDDGSVAFRLGECRFRLGDYPGAIAAYERVAGAFPNDYQPKALFRLGEAHIKLGAFAKARQAFYSLLLLQGRFGSEAKSLIQQAYYRVADCYWNEARQVEEARRGQGR